jgi:hypothetical protein
MIAYHELRIGNFVLADEKQQQIAMIDQRSSTAAVMPVDQTTAGTEHPLSRIMPVPLTDLILEQCGFTYHTYFKFWQ